MCVSCGCGEAFDDHGNDGNITKDKLRDDLSDDELKRAADAQGISVAEVLSNLAAGRKR
jgi:hypothetical protein